MEADFEADGGGNPWALRVLCLLLGVAVCVALLLLKQASDASQAAAARNAEQLEAVKESQDNLQDEVGSRIRALQSEQKDVLASLARSQASLRALEEEVGDLVESQAELIDSVQRVARLVPRAVEPGWRLHETIHFPRCTSARFNPQDGRIYVGRRASAGRGGLFRIDPDGERKVSDGSNLAGLAINYADGSVFYSEDYAGIIYRWTFGATERERWVAGFHSGDDDPYGMAVAGAEIANVVAAGDVLVADRGNNGAKELWRFRADSAEDEVVAATGQGIRHPVDVCIGSERVFFIDTPTSDLTGAPLLGETKLASQVLELLPDGVIQTVPMTRSFLGLHGIAADGNSLLLLDGESGELARLDLATAEVETVIQDLGRGRMRAGLDLSPDGKHLLITHLDRDSIFHFRRD